MALKLHLFFFMVLAFSFQSICPLFAQSGQIAINSIEQMPRFPAPLHIRDWHRLALNYDTLVFDLQASGDYLPLIFTEPGINYPEHEHFGLCSYVGVSSPVAEAINVLPALVSATLNGINKADQNGTNWVLMAEDFFNRRPQENVYLNNFQGQSGNDWWYDTMPNVFFYQLYDLYPGIGHFKQQFRTVADRWLEAVRAMGGRATPWHIPNFYHRAWVLSTMQPNDDGVKEPEAAGAIGWLLYMAYLRTGEEKYRIGAEWCLEYLNEFQANPFYELQLPYGVYVAARMNAELGTRYDISKMLNWCFDPAGNVRGWGATQGNWGGYDCAGLIGEVIGDDYAFAMNTFEMLGALIPMVRYDERFARTIARWALNAINASRLFYANALPAGNQDSEVWDWQYDPKAVISYEALREKDWYGPASPFATGDALRNGWAATNLALYGASHAGILGAIVDTTDVAGILKLNVRATDYFAADSLPVFLLYNPYQRDTSVTIHLGPKAVRIYDLLGNVVLNASAVQATSLKIKADQAILISLIPAEAQLHWQGENLLADSVVVDFHAVAFSGNHPPRIKALQAVRATVGTNQNTDVYCTAEDFDGDALTYRWEADSGKISGQADHVQWTAPAKEGQYTIRCFVSDGTDEVSEALKVTVSNNQAPQIIHLQAQPTEVVPADTVRLDCQATDADGDSLTYRWFVAGQDTFACSAQALWLAPGQRGYYYLHCRVSDEQGAVAEDSIGVTDGDLVLQLLLDGDAKDSSPFEGNGQMHGTVATSGHAGSPNTALYFNGQDAFVSIPNRPWLNFQTAITVSFWMRIDTFFTREAYPISHGNWENRWKISITNRHLRWTVKTETAIYDLDSPEELQKERFYLVTCTYDGAYLKMYLDGKGVAQKTGSGKLLQTAYNLVLGQALPGNLQYGFQGTLDNVFLYNRALNADEVRALYNTQTAIERAQEGLLPERVQLEQNYPNPFNPLTEIRYFLPVDQTVRLDVFDIQGSRLQTLVRQRQKSGWHKVRWNARRAASGMYFFRLLTPEKMCVRKGLKLK